MFVFNYVLLGVQKDIDVEVFCYFFFLAYAYMTNLK